MFNKFTKEYGLDQVAFNEGGITFQNLQTLDWQENTQLYQLYHTSPDAAGKYSLPSFQEEEEREVEVEEVEHQSEGEDCQAPLQHFQGSTLTHSNYILGSENASQSGMGQ